MKRLGKRYAKQTADAYLDSVNDVWQKGQLHFEKIQSHAMTLHALYEEMPESEDVIPLEKLVANTCRFCGICEKMCPWQALAIVEEEGKALLAHHDVLCARCGLCLDLCPEKGLMWAFGLRQKDIASPHWRTLRKGQARRCAQCGEMFYPTEDAQKSCVICRNKI